MKILLFITSIYATLEYGSKEDFEKMAELLQILKKFNDDDLIIVSFCDYTENKNVLQNYLMKLKEKEIYFGEQFSGDLHYISDYGGSKLYKNGKLDKEYEIIDYVKRLTSDGNKVELIVCDGLMNINEYKEKFDAELNCPCSYIYSVKNVKEINDCLEELCEYKKLTFGN